MSGPSIDRRGLIGAGVLGAAALGASGGQALGKTLAPGVAKADFAGALKAFRAVVGDEWVFGDATAVLPWTKSYIPDPGGRHVPVGAVCPQTAEQVQEIVRIANRFKQPLWPVSTGKNMGYGMTTCATPGQVVLDLKRMNRIIAVDPELCTALVEPGVTYQQLRDYLDENNLPLWIDVPTVGPIVGPVGNTLDRGVGYTPYGEHFMVQCGMEVVMPNGEILKTGMGSTSNPSAWQAFKWGYGPYLDGIFTQSNFGVVTKMGMWLMPAPPAYKPFVVRHKRMEDVAKIVEAMRPMRINNIIPNVVLMMSAGYQLAMFSRRGDVYAGSDPVPDAAFAAAAEKVGLGMWNTYFALYGTPVMIAENEKIVRAAFEAIGGEVLTEAEMAGNPYFHHHATLMKGGLSLEEVGLARWKGAGGGLAWFAPVAPAKGGETQGQIALAKQILGKYGFDYTSAFAIGSRELHHIIALLFDKSDPEEEKRADACYTELVTSFGERGWASYRTGVQSMDLVAQQFGAVNRQVNAAIKGALDPNHIIAPGKSGIA